MIKKLLLTLFVLTVALSATALAKPALEKPLAPRAMAVRADEAEPNGDCATANLLTDTMNGEITAGDEILVSMDLIDGYADLAIYLVTDCADVAGSCVAGDDSGNPEEIVYTAEADGDYYLTLDTYSGCALGRDHQRGGGGGERELEPAQEPVSLVFPGRCITAPDLCGRELFFNIEYSFRGRM